MRLKRVIGIIILLVIAVGGGFLWGQGYDFWRMQSSKFVLGVGTKISPISLGQPCDYKREKELDTKGLQCYFYGEMSKEGGRTGIWIQPDIKVATIAEDFHRQINWKTHTGALMPSTSFQFEYPDFYTLEGRAGVSQINYIDLKNLSGETMVTITIHPMFSSLAIAKEFTTTGKMFSTGFKNQHGLEGIVYSDVPSTSLEQQSVQFVLQSLWAKFYIDYKKGYGSDIDYVNDAIVQSFRTSK